MMVFIYCEQVCMFVDNFEGRVGKKKKERKEAMDTTQIYFFFFLI